jgi:hypothetical protein
MRKSFAMNSVHTIHQVFAGTVAWLARRLRMLREKLNMCLTKLSEMSGKQTRNRQTRNGKMMKTKTLFTTMALAGAVMAGTTAVKANSITGTIDMSGTATLNNTSLALATADTLNTGVTVDGGASGTFATVAAGTPVTTFSPFAFTGASVSPLWSFTDAGVTYSFDLSTDSVQSQSSSSLVLGGLGTLNVTGDPSVSGDWMFSINNAGGKNKADFTFGFSESATSVPDGGMTVSLMGVALLGLAAVRRKLGC